MVTYGLPKHFASDFRWSLKGSVAKFDFWGKIQKSGVRNSMTYRLPNSRKSNFATEPRIHREVPLMETPATLPLTIFLVDDNPVDVHLIRWVLDAHKLSYVLQVIDNGHHACE